MVFTHMLVYVRIRLYKHTYIHAYMQRCIYIYIYVCVYERFLSVYMLDRHMLIVVNHVHVNLSVRVYKQNETKYSERIWSTNSRLA